MSKVCIDDSSSEDDYVDSNDEIDQYSANNEVKGLFSNKLFNNIKEMFEYEAIEGDFNLKNVVNKYNLSTIDYIKMINYIRSENPNSQAFKIDYQSANLFPWSDEKYLKTVIDDDPALQLDVEEDLDILDIKTEINNNNISEKDNCMKNLEKKLQEKEHRIEELQEVVFKLRNVAMNLLSDKTIDSDNESSESESENNDSLYVSSYSNYNIHLEMLQDQVRTEGYMNAILENKDLFQDKIVLDVGCGTGILSLFAAKAGAKKVIAVDMSNIIEKATTIAKANGYEEKIVFLKGKIEDITLPVDKVDIIISEWMGYFLLFESMLDSVLFARDKYLNKQTGVVLPNYFEMNLFAVSDQETFDKTINFWSNVYGFNMDTMKKIVVKDSQVQIIDKEKVISDSFNFKEIDCSSCTVKDIYNFESEFCLKINQDTLLTGIGSSFDTFFNHSRLLKKSSFSTSPFHKETHWQQTLFQLEEPVKVQKGDSIKGKIKCYKNPNYLRSYIVELDVFGKINKYKIE